MVGVNTSGGIHKKVIANILPVALQPWMKSLLATEFQLCGGSDAGTGYEGAEVAAMPTAPRISSIMTGVINEENGEPRV